MSVLRIVESFKKEYIYCSSSLVTVHSTVEDGSTGGAWIQKFHEFAKSQIAVKFNKNLPQIIWSWII